ncbi:MAG: hypothetical protein KIH01_06820 [Candidatus Freyarchaeota archaeon]|nr:hypothetical protein [Candidatus Jordarchaeia archaeon]
MVSLNIKVNDLIRAKQDIIPGIARKFRISERQAENFLKIAIEEVAKSKRLSVKGGEISGDNVTVSQLIREVESWNEDEFDEEDFEVLGYCRSIDED